MEALSPTMEEGRLVKWFKNEGDTIANGDTLAEVETDKAIMELVARGEGVLRKRMLAEGDAAPVGTVIAVIADADEDIAALVGGDGASAAASTPGAGDDAKKAPPSAESATATAGAPPQRKDTVDEGGAEDQPPATDTESTQSADLDGEARVGAKTAIESAEGAESAESADATDRAQAHAPRTPMPQAQEHGSEQHAYAQDTGGRLRSSPLARRMASEKGMELDEIRGSGPGGRIVRRDIEAAIASGPTAAKAPAAAAPAPGAAPAGAGAAREGDVTDVPLTQMRKTIARRLSESIGPIPTFYLTAEFDLERAAEMRQAMAGMGDQFKASFNDIVLKAVATALSQHPEVNAHWLGDKIRQHHRVHIGMAVATDDGLIVPVIFDADRKRLSEISREARELAKLARERKLKPEQYTGSTFSVSNLGMFGIDEFTAIINPPESAILAIGAIEEKPVVENGEVQIRRRLRVTLSCDHRVIDGAVGAKFLQTLRRMIENPLMLVF